MPPPRNVPTVVEVWGKTLIIWEDIDNKFLRACLAEFLAMHLFVLLCCGCAMVTLNLDNPNLMMVAASFGFGILVLAQIFGPLSGGHINSAVSLGLFVSGRTSLVKTVCYTISQMFGSVFGALFLWAIFGNNWPAARAFGSNSWDESVFTGGQVFFAEMLGTALLMFNVLSTIDIPTEGGGPLGVYPIAMSVMVAHLFLIPIDGCSINPTRSFGPSLVAQWANIQGPYYHQQVVFWFGPMFGAAVAAFFYEYGTLKPENFAGAKDMDTAIFQAGKKKKKGGKKRRNSQLPAVTIEDPLDATENKKAASPAPVQRYPRAPEVEMTTNPMMEKAHSQSSQASHLSSAQSHFSAASAPVSVRTEKSEKPAEKHVEKPAEKHVEKAAPAPVAAAAAAPPAAPKSAPPSSLPNIPTVPTKPNKKKDKAAPAPAPEPTPAPAPSVSAGYEEFDEEDLM